MRWLYAIFIALASCEADDFHRFVTRPELRAPKLLIGDRVKDATSPGYLFLAPYTELGAKQPTSTEEQPPCETGAHIYDSDGGLIWSGACMYQNRRVMGFMPVEVDGELHLSFHLVGWGKDGTGDERQGSLVLLDSHYEEVQRHEDEQLDFHECAFAPDGNSVVFGTRSLNRRPGPDGHDQNVWGIGFRETDLTTGESLFDWNAVDHGVSLDESFQDQSKLDTPEGWDWIHINSIQKSAHGDFLVSGRHTHTIYKVSGLDQEVIWRLGGRRSDFVLGDGVEFHWQHHATLLHENETHAIISLFDNHNNGRDFDVERYGDRLPSGKIIALDTASTPKTAQLLRRFDRVDGGRSPKLGSVQVLGEDVLSANVLVNWAIHGYLTEYDGQGRNVLEARLASDRFNSYRTFKGPFTGRPVESPKVKMLPIGLAASIGTAFFVSWNGATDVASWVFYGGDGAQGPFTKLQTVARSGFETSWVAPMVVPFGFAIALTADGVALGRSESEWLDADSIENPQFRALVPLLEKAKAHNGGLLRFGSIRPTPLISAKHMVLALISMIAVLLVFARCRGYRLKTMSARPFLRSVLDSLQRQVYDVLPTDVEDVEISERQSFIK